MPVVSHITLHLGAHKTASTHLQRSIGAADLPDAVRFVGPQGLRGKGRSLPERFGFPLDPKRQPPSPVDPARALAQLAQGAARLVLSEESFAGKLQTGWGRIPNPLYHAAPDRVARLVKALQSAGVAHIDLCLAIRDPATFLTSAYSQVLHGRRMIAADKFRAKNPFELIDWHDYVTRLRGVPGISSLTIWRYEDHAAVFDKITQALVGQAVAPLPEVVQPRMSQAAMDAAMLAKEFGVGGVARDAALALPITPQNPAFTLYDSYAQLRSDAFYAAQCAAIAAERGVTFLHAPKDHSPRIA